MSDQPPRKAAKAVASPETTLVNPATHRPAEDVTDAGGEEKKTPKYDDGSDKPYDKPAAPARDDGGATATPLIPVAAPAPAPGARGRGGRGLYPAIPAARSTAAAALMAAAGAGDQNARGRRGFFRPANDGAMGRGRDTTAEQRAREMELLERRLQAQRLAGPTAAEAELRLMQLRYEALKATTARGPRVAQGIFKASCSTDLCFVLDVTGSMQRHINAARDQIKAIVQEINGAFFNEADVRVAVVAYRDHCDDGVRLETLDFTPDVDKVHAFLDGQVARGGGDTAEDVLGGLDAALGLSWRNPTRCIMHIADAPAHGRELHTMSKEADHFLYELEPHGLKYDEVLARMVEKELNYVFFRINDSTDQMALRFLVVYADAAPDAQLCQRNQYKYLAEDHMQSKRAARRAANSNSNPNGSASASLSAGPGDTFLNGALNGGLHFEEVSLGVSYGELSRLVVSGVAASSSRTAVRLSASLSSSRGNGGGSGSGLRSSKRAYQKAKLGDVSEDAELEVVGEETAEEPDDGNAAPDKKKERGLESAITHVNSTATAVANGGDGGDGGESDDDTGRRRTNNVVLETGPPQWDVEGWLDQKIKFKAFSPDVVNTQQMPAGAGGGSGDGSGYDNDNEPGKQGKPERLLDRMIKSDDNIPMSTTELTILRRSKPFAQGALRTASYARTQESTNPLVVKTFKRGDKKLADLAEDMRLQALCKAFALEFNNLVANEQYSLDFVVVTCLQPVHATILSGKDDDDANGAEDECLTLEPLLSTDGGRYVKYNNNCGGVSRFGEDVGCDATEDPASSSSGARPSKAEAKADAKAEAKAKKVAKEAALAADKTPEARARRARRARLAALNAAAQAFSHFTFERSRGRMLVVDLQGVGNVLTDPAIHTRDPTRFVLSDTNLNADGFKLFFATHRCNQLCNHLRLRSNATMFRSNDFAFRTDWPLPGAVAPSAAAASAAGVFRFWKRPSVPASVGGSSTVTGFRARAGTPPDMLVCCANKLCSLIVRVSTAQAAPAGVYWCARCFPQLRSSTVMRVCATPGAYHEFEVSTFFFESQGQILPSTCTAHGGGVCQPLGKPEERASLRQRLSCF